MSTNTIEKPRPHAVLVPFPAQGHLNPMLKLAKLLHHRGFHITFVNTEFNHRRLLNSRGRASLQAVGDSFRFAAIPDGLPPSDADATQDVPSLCAATAKNCLAPFRELLRDLRDDHAVPPVTCIVSDAIMSFTLDVSKELGLPNALFWTASACSLLGYLHYRTLVEKHIFPLKDASYLTNGYLDMILDWIPGMKGIRLKDMPSFLRSTDPNDIIFNFAVREFQRCCDMGSAIILNTFDDLEREVLDSLSSIMPPPIYTIGHLDLLVEDQLVQEHNNPLNLIKTNLWKEDSWCLEWLNSKEPNSVVYVNFGSVAVMTAQQQTEFAWGLANSKQTFMWVVRPDLVVGADHDHDSAILPKEFLVETQERGILISWCPQEEVLRHPSIGGFLTHNGWNSTIESISNGVPVICWPFFADQQTNCWFCCTKWGIGMEIRSDAKRDEIEGLVRELMEGEKGREMKTRAAEWKELAGQAAVAPTGSSNLNLDKMVEQVLLSGRSIVE